MRRCFFEKNATKHRPDWVKTVPIWSEGNNRDVNYILCNDLATLVWVANLAAIELHPSLSVAQDIMCPRSLVFDLDPGPPANILQCCQVAFFFFDQADKHLTCRLIVGRFQGATVKMQSALFVCNGDP